MEPNVFLQPNAWRFAPVPTLLLLVGFGLYFLGWRRRRLQGQDEIGLLHLFSFTLGWCALCLAFLSPLTTLQQTSMVGRAAQQLLVGLIAPPLLWLSRPFPVLSYALPQAWAQRLASLAARRPAVTALIRRTIGPFPAWVLMLAVFMLWHEPDIANWLSPRPAAYLWGLAGLWLTYMLFWWHPLGAGSAIHSTMSPVVGFFYVLLGGEVPNMATGVTLAFRRTPAYSYYAEQAAARGASALQEQMISGGMIWFLGSIVYVVLALAILSRVFRNLQAQSPPPITWDATERTIMPGLEHRVLKP